MSSPASSLDNAERGRVMCALARDAISRALGGPAIPAPEAPWLAARGACFVTLHQDASLRGCVGSLDVRRALGEDLTANAVSAALHDSRFEPLALEELARTRISVSVLGLVVPVVFASERDLLRQFRPGIDGVLVESGPHRGTFLPQVWEQLPEPAEFLRQLKIKAGLSGTAPLLPDVRVSTYSVVECEEPS